MKTIILTFAFVIPSVLFGQLDRSVRPEAGPAPTINIKDSEVFKTANGITVILSENHKLPKVTFNLVVGSSPKMDGAMTGLSDIAGSLIQSGTTNKTKDEIDGEIDYIGASLGADNNSVYLSCLTKHMDKGLSIMSDITMNANFPQSEVDRILKQNESGLMSTKSDAGSMAQNAQAVSIFKNHPYGEVMNESTLANINRDAIVDYYKTTFTPNGSYLTIVGDINKEQATAMVEKYFGSWTGGNPTTTKYPVSPLAKGNNVVFVKKPGAVQSVISIAHPMSVEPSNPDYIKLQVLNGLLGGGVFSNRLMTNLRESKAYTYGCRSSMGINEYGSSFSAGGNFRNDVSDSAITEILYELNRISSELVEDGELAITKSSMAGGFARSLEDPSTIARFALNIIKNKLPSDYYQTYLKKLDAVTKQDVLDVAKKYLTPTNCTIIVVGNEEVLGRLKQFDTDGNITTLDAFGQEVKEMLPADISKEELISKYISAVTLTSSTKALAKKMKKVKSLEEVMDLTMDQVPFPLKSTRVWISPNSEGQKMEGQGMVFQKSFFDGATGGSSSMQGGKTELSAEEIAAKNKSVGLFPEMNYATSGITYELLGIEKKDGKDCYVLKTNDGKAETYDYFDKGTFHKVASTSIVKDGEEVNETSMTYSDFKEQDGFIFPYTMNISMGPANFAVSVTSRTVNAKVDLGTYK
jgi:zinc protease